VTSRNARLTARLHAAGNWLLLATLALGVRATVAYAQERGGSLRTVGIHRLKSGDVIPVTLSSEGLRSAAYRARLIVRTDPPTSAPLSIVWDAANGRAVLAVPTTTPPGTYHLMVSYPGAQGADEGDAFELEVQEPSRLAVTARPPVILINGLQLPTSLPQFLFEGTCPPSATEPKSMRTFGQLESLLTGLDGVPVQFFDNCKECPSQSIEQCAIQLGAFLSVWKYSDGTPVPQFDLVAHSMGGIARAYLSGKQATPGAFAPPANPKVRKLITVGTPHFGSYQTNGFFASIAKGLGIQMNQMTPGSQFLWDLATWNQGLDDLRGVDALAIAGRAGTWPSNPITPNVTDGVVSLTSASLGFARADERTRIVNYCHTSPPSSFMDCTNAQGIADVDTTFHDTGRIVRSFLADTVDWKSIGTTPSHDPYLAVNGGTYVALKDSNDGYVNDITSVQVDGFGALALSQSFFYAEYLPAGQHSVVMQRSAGPVTSTASISPGGFRPLLFKYGPYIYNVQSATSSGLPGLTVASGSTITVNGVGFSSSTGTSLLANGTTLTGHVLSDQQITSFLPASLGGLIRLTVLNGNGQHTINIMTGAPSATSGPSVTSVTNSASSVPGAISPGEIVAIKGSGLGPTTGVLFSVNPATGKVDSTLAGTRVLFGAFAAPITYTSATQINAIVPYEVAGQSQVVMQVQYQGVQSAGTLLQVANAAPGAFTANSTGSGQAAALNQDGSVNGPSNPAAKGSYATIYFTGGGQTNPPGVTGSVTGLVLKWLAQGVSVTVGGQLATVAFDGAAPTFVDGVGQLNIKLADNTPTGSAQPIVITVGGINSTTTATLAVR
jgi:uncharacterized protein (TIGR03437 family)